MYSPEQFAEPRIEVMQDLIRQYPLATLVTLAGDGLNANHIPLHLCGDDGSAYGCLRGHVARANPLWRADESSAELLAIFQAPNAYISPSWYASKRETGRVVPTWNYAAVHAYGRLQAVDDPVWILDQIVAMTAAQEAAFFEPWAVADAPADFTERLLTQIVGIEIRITRLLGKWKVSQNQPAANRSSVIAGLRETGHESMADLVAERSEPAARNPPET